MSDTNTRPCPIEGHGTEPVLQAYPAADGRENVWLACGWVGLMAAPVAVAVVTEDETP